MMMFKDTRRSLLSMSSSALLCLAVSACGSSGSDSTDTETSTAAPTTAAEPTLTIASVKTFSFTWTDVADATYYQLYENADGSSGFTQVGDDIDAGEQNYEYIVPLYARTNASYLLSTCNDIGCIDSSTVTVGDNLNDAIGYFKASNTATEDYFGSAVSLSDDGTILAVGAEGEDSSASGIAGDQDDDSAAESGAVYVFTLDDTTWSQQAYIKASNPDGDDNFGSTLSLSGDGNTLAIGAQYEDSDATGINGDQTNDLSSDSGAVYVFTFDGTDWSQQAYIKASNTYSGDEFGTVLSLSDDGNILAVGAQNERSNATGVNGNQTNNDITGSGAVYVFNRDGTTWTQDAYIKASNRQSNDYFGTSLALSGDGSTLAVGADEEDSGATGINGNETDDSTASSGTGAAYVFVNDGSSWSQEAYIKASNADKADFFGTAVALSDDGNTLAVGANYEDSNATGIDGDQTNDNAFQSGAVYVFIRTDTTWSQQAYLKASETNSNDFFGTSLSLGDDGNTLVVRASSEDSSATGINGDGSNTDVSLAGAVYLFTRDASTWNQEAYIKASNTDEDDKFGFSLSLSGDGETLAASALEDSNATGIGGDETNNDSDSAGAVYLY